MIELGCSVGYFTEYVPCGPDAIPEWVLNEEERATFHQTVLDLRRRKPIVLIQFPHDEYGVDNRCSAAGNKSMHINSQGDVEPCPFVPIARENIRHGGLKIACESPFLRSIREHPDLLRRNRYACALWEHREEIERLVKIGADKTPSRQSEGRSI
jgi:MoaA/NifB/PqqE/SkfB family radical SAM enzyme